jgi:hypothetical protein
MSLGAVNYLGSINGANKLTGTLSGTYIYNRALSAAEVLSLYEAGAPAGADYNNASNTSLITGDNSTFAADTSYWSRVGGATIATGQCVLANTGQYITKSGIVTIGKRYRVWLSNVSGSGNVVVYIGNSVPIELAYGSSLDFEGTATTSNALTIATTGSLTIDTVTLVPVGVILSPDETQNGSGTNWYDTSGNSASIALPASGVSWLARSNPDLRVTGTGIFGAYAGGAYTAGDIIARRSSTTGAIRFGDSAGTYLYFDGGKYEFGGTPGLDVGGQITGKTGGVFYRGTNNSGSTLLALKRADGTTNLLTATDSADGLTLKLGYTGLGTTSNWVSLYGTGNDGAGLQINSGQTAAVGQIVFSNEAKARWQIQRDPSVTEAGSNAGSDFKISAYNDAGNAVLSTPLTISRATGITTLTGLVVTNTAKIGASGAPDSRLHVYENTAVNVANGVTIEQAGTGDAAAAFLLTGVQRWSIGIDNSDSDKFKIGTGELGSADKVTLDTSGNLTATGNITAYYSDERLKTRLGNIENAIEKVKTLSGFYFAPNDTAMALGYQKKVDVGVSAQEVKAILPEVIAPAPIDPQYMTVRYEKLIPLLIEAIKEQQEQIETLKQMVAALTAK